MRFVIFSHSLVSDWNHGNAHFLRGIALELLARNHEVSIFEPTDGWSRANLLRDHGPEAVAAFHDRYPTLHSNFYDERSLDLDAELKDADIVIVHEWNSCNLVAAIGDHRRNHDYQLYFHDTHHRIVSDHNRIAAYDLRHYDGVLAYGSVIRDAYLELHKARNVFTWHEAADTRTFYPFPAVQKQGDLVWIGNWGDGERAESLREFLIDPVRRLGLKARIYGVRYPAEVLEQLSEAGIEYGGWLPNFRVPGVFARYRVTVHVPRGPYVKTLPGIPTIRPFEALACGIPLVCAPWQDCEHLFTPGHDFLFARDGNEMTKCLRDLTEDTHLAQSLSANGLKTIQTRHTCRHRVDELFTIMESISSHSRVMQSV